ncbi:hypothetical protein [Burkholderia gladioli]|uniref:hypothetical protein n=1 Tax=Burkholderia gladioli TaxID=28095 RepID=UPI002FE1AD82
MTIQIEELRFDERPWRLDWLGRIDYKGSSQSEPKILVYLSALKADYSKVLANGALATPHDQRAVSIKVGQLPLLTIGSVWINGVRQPLRESLDEIDLVLDHTQVDMIRFDGGVEIDGDSVPVIAKHRYRISSEGESEVAGSWLAVAYNPKPKVRFVAIPSTVLFQRCLATSPKAIRRLMLGQLDRIVAPESGFVDGAPDTFYVNLHKDYRDAEAPALANLIADPVARSEFNRFRSVLRDESGDFDRSSKASYLNAHVKLGLPFSNPVQIKVRGKYLPFEVPGEDKGAKTWGFLATEIVDLDVNLIFEKLVVDRKNNSKQGKNANDPTLPVAFPNTEKASTKPSEQVQVVTSGLDPNVNLEKLSLEACGGFGAVGLTVISESKEVQHYQARSVTPVGGEEVDGAGSTGDWYGDVVGATEVDIESSQTPSFPVTLEQFLETLDLLSKQGIRLSTIVASTLYRNVDNHVVNYLPRAIKNVRSWHLISGAGRAVPRGYIVAAIRHADAWHYLIELERKGNEALALAHVRNRTGEQIEHTELARFMVDVARENGWNAVENYKHWTYQPIRHTPSRGPDAFASAITAKLF